MNISIKKHIFWLFLLPSLAGMVFFYVIPLFISVYYALIDNIALRQFVGVDNFIRVFKSLAFRTGLSNTLVFIGISVPLNMIISFLIALAINKIKRIKTTVALILMLPLALPSGTVAFFWKCLFDYNGILNKLRFANGIPIYDFFQSGWAMLIVVIIFLWKSVGYNMVLFWAGLGLIPNEYYEHAVMEGAGGLQTLRHITLVYITPTTFLTLIMSVVNSFKVFKEIYLLFGNYPDQSIYMLQHYINNQFFSINFQNLATSFLITTAFMTIIVLILFKIQKKFSDAFN